MTLYESLQDIGKGRFCDNGCDYDLVALAKGTYIFEFSGFSCKAPLEITLTGTQGENAKEIERKFYEHNKYCDSVTRLTYKRLKGGKR